MPPEDTPAAVRTLLKSYVDTIAHAHTHTTSHELAYTYDLLHVHTPTHTLRRRTPSVDYARDVFIGSAALPVLSPDYRARYRGRGRSPAVVGEPRTPVAATGARIRAPITNAVGTLTRV